MSGHHLGVGGEIGENLAEQSEKPPEGVAGGDERVHGVEIVVAQVNDPCFGEEDDRVAGVGVGPGGCARRGLLAVQVEGDSLLAGKARSPRQRALGLGQGLPHIRVSGDDGGAGETDVAARVIRVRVGVHDVAHGPTRDRGHGRQNRTSSAVSGRHRVDQREHGRHPSRERGRCRRPRVGVGDQVNVGRERLRPKGGLGEVHVLCCRTEG